jgi:hypothetical protein
MKTASPLILLTIAISFAVAGARSHAQETKPIVEEKLVFKTDWKGERITLPPSFAPDMELKGIEVIRFAPGMFDARSDSFFSYAFVFSVAADQKLSQEVIQKETLTYYRGLSKNVLKSKGVEVDASKFTFALEKAKAVKEAPESVVKPETFTQYSGKLDWVEPFATAKAQTLHFEIQAWGDSDTGRNYLFVCTSPRSPGETDPVWKTLREIRRSFTVRGDAKK